MDHAFFERANSGLLDVKGRIKIGPSDLQVDYGLSLPLQFLRSLHHLANTREWYFLHSLCFPRMTHYNPGPFSTILKQWQNQVSEGKRYVGLRGILRKRYLKHELITG
jgi:hypothetical protein